MPAALPARIQIAALSGALLVAQSVQAETTARSTARVELEAGGALGAGFGTAAYRWATDVVGHQPVHPVASLHLAGRLPVGHYVTPGVRLEISKLWAAAEAEARLFPFTHDVGWWLGCHAGVAGVPRPTEVGRQFSGPWGFTPILGVSVGKTWLPVEVFAITLDLSYRALLLPRSGYEFSAVGTTALDGVQQDVKLGLSFAARL